eukprot:TRINITY_DN27333_c0_g1_i1.p1 TRINITY_DN27333_c0_g1~~TRINITY_DN27333_c0_g1_i1.p1  ORF type:complete len:291 (+),score=94.36 TRINITY_DN27333_c0_g1_i1:113-985(+)
MYCVRLSDRRRPPERVEGVDENTTVAEIKSLACWVLEVNEDLPPSCMRLFMKKVELEDDAKTIGEYGVPNLALLQVDIDPAVSKEERAKRKATVEGAERAEQVKNLRIFQGHEATAPTGREEIAVMASFSTLAVDKSGALLLGSATSALALTPVRCKAASTYWSIQLSGAFALPRMKNSFRIPLTPQERGTAEIDPVEEIRARLVGSTLWLTEWAPDRTCVSLFFAMERLVWLFAYRNSTLLQPLPWDAARLVHSFLSPAGEVEITAVDGPTRLGLPLNRFEHTALHAPS